MKGAQPWQWSDSGRG